MTPKKTPVSKLAAKNIDEGYEILNRILETLNKKTPKPKLGELTAEFYEAIPHENEYKKTSSF